MSAHLKTCKVKKCHAFLKLPVGDGEVKPFLTPEMTSRPDVKLAMHKLLNNLQMVYYHDWTEASIYFEKEDFLQLKKSPARDQEDKDADDLPQVRLIDHLPLAAFQCSSPALTTFEYADEYAGFGWPIKNSEGVTLLDCVQSLTMGIGYVMKENWKMMQMDRQMDALEQECDGDEEDLDMLSFELSEKLDQEWEKNEDYLRLGVADEFMGDHKFFAGFYPRRVKGALTFGVHFE